MSISRKKMTLYFLLVFVLVIAALGYRIYSQLTDLGHLKGTLAQVIGEMTGSEVVIGSAELDFSQGIGIKLKRVSLLQVSSGSSEVLAKEVLIVIRILPLLVQKISIKKIVMRGSSIKLKRGFDGKFDFMSKVNPSVQKTVFETGLLNLAKLWFMPQLEVQDGEIQFFDEYERSGQDPIYVKNIHFSIRKVFALSPLGFSARGEIPHPYGNAVLDISGNLKNLSNGFDFSKLSIDGHITIHKLFLPQFRPYVSKVFRVNPGKVSFSMESDFSIGLDGVNRFSGKMRLVSPRQKDAPFLGPHRGLIHYTVYLHEDTLNVAEASLHFGDFAIKGNGRLARWTSERPEVSFNVHSEELLVDSVEGQSLLRHFPEKLERFFQEYVKHGMVKIRSLKFGGTLEQLRRLDVQKNRVLLSGELGFREVDLSWPALNLDKLTGTLRFGMGESKLDIQQARFHRFPRVSLAGGIGDLMRQPVGDLTLKGKLSLSQLKEILETGIPDRGFRDLLSRYREVAGDGKVWARVKGNLGDWDRLFIKGGFSIENGSLREQDAPHPVTNLSGKVNVIHAGNGPSGKTRTGQTWRIGFENVSGDFGENRFYDLKGELLLGREAPFIKTSGTFLWNAAEAIRLLPRHLENASYLRKVRFLGGTVLADYQGEGNPLAPQTIQYKVVLGLENVSMRWGDGSALWRNLSGQVEFDPGRINFKQVRGRLGGSWVDLAGDVVIGGASPRVNVHLTSAAFFTKDFKGVPFLEQIKIRGPVRLDTRWTGSPQSIAFQGSADLTQAAYAYRDDFVKKAKMPNSVWWMGRFSKKRSVVIQKLIYELGDNKLEGEGTIRNFPEAKFDFRISGQDLQTLLLARNLSFLENNRSGSIDVDLRAQGAFADLESTALSGTLKFNDLVFKGGGSLNPLIVSAKVKLLNKRLEIQDGKFASADSRFDFKGVYLRQKRPQLSIELSGKKLNLNRIWAGPQNASPGAWALLEKLPVFSSGIGRLAFDFKKFDFKFWSLKNVLGKISLRNKTLWVDKLEVTIANKNRIQAKGMFAALKPSGIRFESTIEAQNIHADDFLSQFGGSFKNGLTGKLKLLKVSLQSEGTGRKEILNALNGTVSFNMVSGKVNPRRLKEGLFEVFGIPRKASAARGKPPTPYRRISGDFVINRGVAKTENFLYETPERATSLVGKFDLNRSKMTAMVGVAHLPGLDRFLTRIPLVGKIITAGDEGSLVKTYYSVRGAFDSPKITAVPLKSLQKKILGIFQGILQTPGNILSPSP